MEHLLRIAHQNCKVVCSSRCNKNQEPEQHSTLHVRSRIRRRCHSLRRLIWQAYFKSHFSNRLGPATVSSEQIPCSQLAFSHSRRRARNVSLCRPFNWQLAESEAAATASRENAEGPNPFAAERGGALKKAALDTHSSQCTSSAAMRTFYVACVAVRKYFGIIF